MYIFIYREIYYKELVQMIMESEKSLDLHSASWRHSGADTVVSKLEGLKPEKPMVISILNASSLET